MVLRTVLLAHIRTRLTGGKSVRPTVMREIDKLNTGRLRDKARIVELRKLYPRYEYSDLAGADAILHFPYQTSYMSLFEMY